MRPRTGSTHLALLNAALGRQGFEAFYATDKQCYLRRIATNTVATKWLEPAPSILSVRA